MEMIVRAYPIASSVSDVERFAAELNARPAETAAFYNQFGVSHESWHVQTTIHGTQLISVTMVERPTEAAQAYAATTREFDAWFKQRVLQLSGIDPNTQPLGPPSTQVFAWSADAGASS